MRDGRREEGEGDVGVRRAVREGKYLCGIVQMSVCLTVQAML